MTHGSQLAPTIVVAGFGPVGAACAIALADALPAGTPIIVLNPHAQIDAGKSEQRSIAVSYGSRILLERLGAWDGRVATPIRRIHVSQQGAFGRTLLKSDDYGIDALGYVIAYPALTKMLTDRVAGLGIDVREDVRIAASEPGDDKRRITLSDGTSIDADYVIHAEGQPADGAGLHTRDYRQSALTARVTCARPLADTAFERFTREGPLALLPAGDGYALVWCAKPLTTARRLALPDADLLLELHQVFGDRLGRFLSLGPRSSVALGLNIAPAARTLREFAIGNAAQALHPVAGQGFNLGLRDAFSVSDAIATEGGDALRAQGAFLASRKLDRTATIGMTDLLSRVFATPLWPLPVLRAGALAALDIIPALRHPLARQMMNGQR